jgi:hypothetical protein
MVELDASLGYGRAKVDRLIHPLADIRLTVMFSVPPELGGRKLLFDNRV